MAEDNSPAEIDLSCLNDLIHEEHSPIEPLENQPELYSLSEDWEERFGQRVTIDESSADWLFLSLLTVPDETRYPPPESGGGCRIDLSVLNEKTTAAAIGKMVTEALPDDQLLALEQHELTQAEVFKRKPRRVAWEKIQAQKNRRGPVYQKWMNETAADVLKCRISAMGIGVGKADPKIFVVGVDGSECDLLAEFWGASNGTTIAGAGVCDALRLIAVRSVFYDLESRRANRAFPVPSRLTDAATSEVAAAVGLSFDPLPSAASVFEATRDCNAQFLVSACRDLFEVSRCIVLAEYTVS